MIKGSQNLLIVGPGRGVGSSHDAIWWNLVLFFYVQAEKSPSKRQLDGSLAKFLCDGGCVDGVVVVLMVVVKVLMVVVMMMMMVFAMVMIMMVVVVMAVVVMVIIPVMVMVVMVVKEP